MVLLTCRSSLIRFRPEMSPEFTSVFNGLRGILEKNAARLSVGKDRPDYIGLEAQVGPATLQAWGGRQKSATIPPAALTHQLGEQCFVDGLEIEARLALHARAQLLGAPLQQLGLG